MNSYLQQLKPAWNGKRYAELSNDELAAYNRAWREKNRERDREYKRRWRVANREHKRLANKVYNNDPKNEKKIIARRLLNLALKKGWITKPSGKQQFHHPDYDRPYYGCWVTHLEHGRIHSGLIECLPCTDYSESIGE